MYKNYTIKPGIPNGLYHKIWLIMRLTTVLLIVAIMQVSATSLAQKITLSKKDAPMKEIIKTLRQQSGYDFIATEDLLDQAKSVTIQIKNKDIKDALESIFENQPITYTIDNNTVTLKPKEKGFFENLVARFQAMEVKGKVVDEQGGPLPGASIKVKGKNLVAITDTKGEFTIQNVAEDAILEISYVGYQTKEIKAQKELGNISLSQSSADLQTVEISKGYYSTTKALNTGNVSVVESKDISKNPVGDPLQALQGRVAGLYIAQNSGVVGSESRVQIRGRNSIANGNDPLYIVDGVPFPSTSISKNSLGTASDGVPESLSNFGTLNIDNIERIEVLKDADATAIYGSRGANGVILITTKKGKAGKTAFSANVYSGAGKSSRKLDLMNTSEYLAMRRQAFANDGIPVPDYEQDLNGAYGDINQYTDWQDLFIGGTAKLTDATASVSGGSDQTQFLLGMGLRNEGTVFPGDFRDQKVSFNGNINHTDGKFKSSFSINYMNDNNRMATTDFSSTITLSPNMPVPYKPDGSFNWQNSVWVNPVWLSTLKSTSITQNLNGSLNLSYEIIKGLSATLRGGYNDITSSFSAPNARVDYDPAIVTIPTRRRHAYGNSRNKTWIVEPGLNYSQQIGPGKLDALIGLTIQQSDRSGRSFASAGYATAALIINTAAATITAASDFLDNRYRYNAGYARIGYNIGDQYLLNLTGRRDASSRFGPGKQFANLGAIGAAWIFSQQPIFKSELDFISLGKLRASYGITGNDQLKDYQYLSTYTPNSISYQTNGTLNPTQLTNSEFGWETVKKLEAGLELGFFKDRIFLNASWYRNRTGNQLVGYALPSITGFTTVQANLPAVVQNSGTEFELSAEALRINSFKWTVSGNVSVPRNKLVSYPNLAGSSYASTFVIGQPLDISFMYQYKGVDPVKHIYTFEDLDGDGQITRAGDRSPRFIGQDFFGGINNSFSYKGLQLDVFFQFVKQDGYRFVSPITPGNFYSSFGSNQLRSLADEVANGKAEQYTAGFGTDASNAYALFTESSGQVQDASFIRLKNVSLSWTLPQKVQNALHLRSAKIFMQGQNLLTFTKYAGFDPEVSSGSLPSSQLKLPPLRMMVAGIQLSL